MSNSCYDPLTDPTVSEDIKKNLRDIKRIETLPDAERLIAIGQRCASYGDPRSALYLEAGKKDLRTWASSTGDSHGFRDIHTAPENTPQQCCQVCNGKGRILLSSSCLPAIETCPRCQSNPSVRGRQVIGHTQIIHFISGKKQTIRNVQEHWENEMTHVIDGTGKEWIINKANVLCVEVVP